MQFVYVENFSFAFLFCGGVDPSRFGSSAADLVGSGAQFVPPVAYY